MDKEDSFGDRLKKARSAAGFTQEQLAIAVGKKSKLSISGWEQGKQTPPIDTLKDICEVLACSADYLLYGKNIVNVPPEGYELIKTSEWTRVLRQANENLTNQNERLTNNQTVPHEA